MILNTMLMILRDPIFRITILRNFDLYIDRCVPFQLRGSVGDARSVILTTLVMTDHEAFAAATATEPLIAPCMSDQSYHLDSEASGGDVTSNFAVR